LLCSIGPGSFRAAATHWLFAKVGLDSSPFAHSSCDLKSLCKSQISAMPSIGAMLLCANPEPNTPVAPTLCLNPLTNDSASSRVTRIEMIHPSVSLASTPVLLTGRLVAHFVVRGFR
jgi:hypothetical protein